MRGMMPKFSKQSIARLKTCHPLLQVIAMEAIKEFDFAVICGHRTPAEQKELFAQGRTKAGRIVTNIDGVTKKSQHNFKPSLAMDLAPFPIDWNDLARFDALAAIIIRIAKENAVPLTWGGSWKRFPDKPHFQLEYDLLMLSNSLPKSKGK